MPIALRHTAEARRAACTMMRGRGLPAPRRRRARSAGAGPTTSRSQANSPRVRGGSRCRRRVLRSRPAAPARPGTLCSPPRRARPRRPIPRPTTWRRRPLPMVATCAAGAHGVPSSAAAIGVMRWRTRRCGRTRAPDRKGVLHADTSLRPSRTGRPSGTLRRGRVLGRVEFARASRCRRVSRERWPRHHGAARRASFPPFPCCTSPARSRAAEMPRPDCRVAGDRAWPGSRRQSAAGSGHELRRRVLFFTTPAERAMSTVTLRWVMVWAAAADDGIAPPPPSSAALVATAPAGTTRGRAAERRAVGEGADDAVLHFRADGRTTFCGGRGSATGPASAVVAASSFDRLALVTTTCSTPLKRLEATAAPPSARRASRARAASAARSSTTSASSTSPPRPALAPRPCAGACATPRSCETRRDARRAAERGGAFFPRRRRARADQGRADGRGRGATSPRRRSSSRRCRRESRRQPLRALPERRGRPAPRRRCARRRAPARARTGATRAARRRARHRAPFRRRPGPPRPAGLVLQETDLGHARGGGGGPSRAGARGRCTAASVVGGFRSCCGGHGEHDRGLYDEAGARFDEAHLLAARSARARVADCRAQHDRRTAQSLRGLQRRPRRPRAHCWWPRLASAEAAARGSAAAREGDDEGAALLAAMTSGESSRSATATPVRRLPRRAARWRRPSCGSRDAARSSADVDGGARSADEVHARRDAVARTAADMSRAPSRRPRSRPPPPAASGTRCARRAALI